MDALRRALALSIAVIAVLCVVPASWDDADAAGRLDGLIQRTVYVNKYSRKKER